MTPFDSLNLDAEQLAQVEKLRGMYAALYEEFTSLPIAGTYFWEAKRSLIESAMWANKSIAFEQTGPGGYVIPDVIMGKGRG